MKWEYKTIKMGTGNFVVPGFELTEVDKFINQFGQIGWELISVKNMMDLSNAYVIFIFQAACHRLIFSANFASSLCVLRGFS
jgi:hypothetical protein